MSTKVSITENYCSLMKKLLQFYYDKSNEKNNTHCHIRRGIIFINDFPINAIESTGAKLYKYKDIVNSGNLGQINKHVDNEKKEAPESQSDIADSVLNNVCQIWQMSDDKNKKEIIDTIQFMLKLYINYLLIQKRELSK